MEPAPLIMATHMLGLETSPDGLSFTGLTIHPDGASQSGACPIHIVVKTCVPKGDA